MKEAGLFLTVCWLEEMYFGCEKSSLMPIFSPCFLVVDFVIFLLMLILAQMP